MWKWILENTYMCVGITLFLFILFVYAYITVDCDIVEAWERIKHKRRNRKHKRIANVRGMR